MLHRSSVIVFILLRCSFDSWSRFWSNRGIIFDRCSAFFSSFIFRTRRNDAAQFQIWIQFFNRISTVLVLDAVRSISAFENFFLEFFRIFKIFDCQTQGFPRLLCFSSRGGRCYSANLFRVARCLPRFTFISSMQPSLSLKPMDGVFLAPDPRLKGRDILVSQLKFGSGGL